MAHYKGTWTGWQKKNRPHGVQKYITPKDRAFNLFSGGTPVLGKTLDTIQFHEQSILWASALKAVEPCEKPYLVKVDRCTGENPDYEDIEMSCFEFIQLYADDRSRVEPHVDFGGEHSFEYCVVCDVARRIYRGVKE